MWRTEASGGEHDTGLLLPNSTPPFARLAPVPGPAGEGDARERRERGGAGAGASGRIIVADAQMGRAPGAAGAACGRPARAGAAVAAGPRGDRWYHVGTAHPAVAPGVGEPGRHRRGLPRLQPDAGPRVVARGWAPPAAERRRAPGGSGL